QLSAVVDSLQGKVKQLAEVLSLELPEDADYAKLYQQAHLSLASAAEDAAIELSRSQSLGLSNDPNVDPAQDEALASETNRLIEAVRHFTHSTHKQLQPTAIRAKPAGSAQIASGGTTSTSQPAVPQSAQFMPPHIPPDSAAESENASERANHNTPVETALAIPPLSDASISTEVDSDILLAHTTKQLIACRQARKPLSLILVEVDRARADAPKRDSEQVHQFAQLVGLVCGKIDHLNQTQLNITENLLALILPNCDRPAARAFGHMIVDEVRRVCARSDELTRAKLTVSVGVATIVTPAKNFLAQNLIASADRCLHAAQLCGGNAIKSIDVL
ncbi:MAG TPA: GGDEF domain-containing protein, partial [Pirellulales bacterium]